MDFNEAFLKFKERYELQHPQPDMAKMRRLGWEFYLSLIWAVAAVLMVASQTASEFYHAKTMSGMAPELAIGASFLVLIAIEGGLVIGAAIKASGARRYNKSLVSVAMALTVIISMVAGLNSSMGIIPNIDPEMLKNLRISLVFALGLGGSLVAWAAGEVLGTQIAKKFVDGREASDQFEDAMTEYNERMLRSWQASPEYVIVRAPAKEMASELRGRKVRPKLSETFRNEAIDYRNLSTNEQRKLLEKSWRDIMDEYGVIERTARNWESYAQRDHGNGTGE